MKNAYIFGGLMLGMLTFTAIMMNTMNNYSSKPNPYEITNKHEKYIREHFKNNIRYKYLQNNPFTFEETDGGVYVIYTVTTPNGAYEIPTHKEVKDFIATTATKREYKITKKNF